jgi:hypothetical protein
MSCGTNRCALRRFDGHGSSSYRPSNPEATKAFNSSVQSMLAERARQDAGIFTAPSMPAQSVQEPVFLKPQSIQPSQLSQQSQPSNQTFYSLSDSNMKS